MRISDWSSDVCSSDLRDRQSFGIAGLGLRCRFHDQLVAVDRAEVRAAFGQVTDGARHRFRNVEALEVDEHFLAVGFQRRQQLEEAGRHQQLHADLVEAGCVAERRDELARISGGRHTERDDQTVLYGNHERSGDKRIRSEEHTSELQSLMSISYAVFCLKKKNK